MVITAAGAAVAMAVAAAGMQAALVPNILVLAWTATSGSSSSRDSHCSRSRRPPALAGRIQQRRVATR